MNQEPQRAAFEAWCKERFGQIPLWVEEDGEYLLSSVQLRFEAYQAAVASPEVQALRKDAERLDFLTKPESSWFVQWGKRSGKPVRFRMIDDGDVFGKWNDTARQAINAAMEKQKCE